MLQDLCVHPQPQITNGKTIQGSSAEKIIIIIEAGKVVWFNTNGKFPPTENHN